jgi:hypothetical protein
MPVLDHHTGNADRRVSEMDPATAGAAFPDPTADLTVGETGGAVRTEVELAWPEGRLEGVGHDRSFALSRPNPKTRVDMKTRRPQATAAALFASAVTWAGIASTTDVYPVSSSFVLGAGLLLISAVSIVGMVAGAARWALRLALGSSAVMVALGLLFPLTPWTVAAMALAGAAAAGLAGTGFDGMIRKRPPADGPPARSVLLSLLLLAAPPMWALVAPDGLGVWGLIAVAVAWVTMAWYAKAAPGALPAVRVVSPLVLAVTAVMEGLPAGAVVGATAACVAALAWTVDARIAVHPLAEPGTTVPIPPELAPRDVLDAAGIDDRGRRKEQGT